MKHLEHYCFRRFVADLFVAHKKEQVMEKQGERLLRLKQVLELVPVSKST